MAIQVGPSFRTARIFCFRKFILLVQFKGLNQCVTVFCSILGAACAAVYIILLVRGWSEYEEVMRGSNFMIVAPPLYSPLAIQE